MTLQDLPTERHTMPLVPAGHTSPTVAAGRTARRWRRVRSVAIAVAATCAIYQTASWAGVDFDLTDPGKTQPVHLTLMAIGVVTLFFAIAGWAALAVLERVARRRAATVWRVLATSVLLLSYVPIGIEQATAGTKVMLTVIHTAVAVALLPLARRHDQPLH